MRHVVSTARFNVRHVILAAPVVRVTGDAERSRLHGGVLGR
jgi:hypothetical protein